MLWKSPWFISFFHFLFRTFGAAWLQDRTVNYRSPEITHWVPILEYILTLWQIIFIQTRILHFFQIQVRIQIRIRIWAHIRIRIQILIRIYGTVTNRRMTNP